MTDLAPVTDTSWADPAAQDPQVHGPQLRKPGVSGPGVHAPQEHDPPIQEPQECGPAAHDPPIQEPQECGPAAHDPASLISEVLAGWSEDPRLVHQRELPARPAHTGTLARPLPVQIQQRLPHRQLWRHQAAAIDLARAGTSFTLATGTASGKSLAYQVPIAEAALDGGTSLLIYPTKALAQDQLLSFGAWDIPGMVPATYDGDCTPEERTWVREQANVLLTNPEMLHHGILPNHRRWARFLHTLRYVVIDELHTLRGVFGTHLAQVLRRLRRLVAHYGGAEPTFMFTSATIGSPEVLASELCGLPVVPVDGDGAPAGHRTVALWHPGSTGGTPHHADSDPLHPDPTDSDPLHPDPTDSDPLHPGSTDSDPQHSDSDQQRTDSDPHHSDRWSVHAEAGLLASTLIDAGLRTLVFCRSRRGTELVAEDIRRTVRPELADTVRSYRAGYLPAERRQIEADLFGGRLRGVVATNALELGVDIGGLDAVVLCGYPGTISSFWQQVGRGGRGGEPSLAVLVAGEDQLDQWMMRHPDELFGRAPERAVINLDNPHVYVPHLGCAANELPLGRADGELWPEQLDEGVRQLVVSDRATVRRRKGEPTLRWSGRGTPAPTIGLRSASRGEYRICDTDERTIGTVDDARAFSVVHPGAVYLHQGRAWKVLDLDRERHRAVVEPASGDHYTQPRTETTIRLHDADDERQVGCSTLRLGSVEVTNHVVGYRVRSVASHEVAATESLELPPTHLSTRAVWYVIGDEVVERAAVAAPHLPGALHAAEHAAIGILPLFTICDRWDVGGVSTEWLPETGAATVVIHDAHPGGSGIAELAFAAADRHLAATLSVIEECDCTDGCPSCVQSPKCGNNNEPLDRDAAIRLLRAALQRH